MGAASTSEVTRGGTLAARTSAVAAAQPIVTRWALCNPSASRTASASAASSLAGYAAPGEHW